MSLRRAFGKSVELVGHDISYSTAKMAQRRGAVDSVSANLPRAVETATMVIIATPVMAIREILETIAPNLSSGCIVTDTASTKQAVIEWANTHLPKNVSFVGCNPLIFKGISGIQGAHQDLFENAFYCVCPSPQASKESVESVTNMIKAVGARPYYIDAAEHDSYSAAVHQLPLIMSSALVTTASQSTSWRDISKQAAGDFEAMSKFSSQDPLENLDACITNKEALTNYLDQTIHELIKYRRLLAEDTEGLGKLFSQAFSSRAQWLNWRENGFPTDDAAKLPPMGSFGDRMTEMLVGGALMERYRRFEEVWQDREKRRERRDR